MFGMVWLGQLILTRVLSYVHCTVTYRYIMRKWVRNLSWNHLGAVVCCCCPTRDMHAQKSSARIYVSWRRHNVRYRTRCLTWSNKMSNFACLLLQEIWLLMAPSHTFRKNNFFFYWCDVPYLLFLFFRMIKHIERTHKQGSKDKFVFLTQTFYRQAEFTATFLLLPVL
jgi:hypothetical protein